MIVQRYKVAYAERITHSVLQQGHPFGRALEGVRVRAEPVRVPSDAPEAGLFAHTPGHVVGFSVYGPDAARLVVGAEFTLTLDLQR